MDIQDLLDPLHHDTEILEMTYLLARAMGAKILREIEAGAPVARADVIEFSRILGKTSEMRGALLTQFETRYLLALSRLVRLCPCGGDETLNLISEALCALEDLSRKYALDPG